MTDLGKVMVVPKGAYNANTTYEVLDLVTYNGSSYIALKSTKGNVPTNATYWQLHGQGYPGSAAGVSAKDTQGMVVTTGSNSTVQALIDAIADRVMTKLLAKTAIVQTESTATDKVPSSAYIKQALGTINSNIADVITNADIQAGNTPLGDCVPGKTTDFQIIFPKPFSSIPKVMVCLRSSSQSEKYGLLTPYVANISKTSFTFRVANAHTTLLTPGGTWYAML